MSGSNGEIKIEKGIPMPNAHRRRYPLRSMEYNDSFFSAESQNKVRSATSYFSARNPEFKFITRTVTENGVKGVRVWRIA